MAANQTVTVHGTKVSSFLGKDVTAHKRSVRGVGYPFGADQYKGGIFSHHTDIKLIRGAVNQVIQTEKGERIMLPNFGCNLRKYLFQPLDEVTFEAIKEEIVTSINKYIVGVKILKISVFPFGEIGPAGGNSLKIILILQLVEEDLTVFDVEVQIK